MSGGRRGRAEGTGAGVPPQPRGLRVGGRWLARSSQRPGGFIPSGVRPCGPQPLLVEVRAELGRNVAGLGFCEDVRGKALESLPSSGAAWRRPRRKQGNAELRICLCAAKCPSTAGCTKGRKEKKTISDVTVYSGKSVDLPSSWVGKVALWVYRHNSALDVWELNTGNLLCMARMESTGCSSKQWP